MFFRQLGQAVDLNFGEFAPRLSRTVQKQHQWPSVPGPLFVTGGQREQIVEFGCYRDLPFKMSRLLPCGNRPLGKDGENRSGQEE